MFRQKSKLAKQGIDLKQGFHYLAGHKQSEAGEEK
jgi:hypothetical protein